MAKGNWCLLVGRFISPPNGQIETVSVFANCWNLKLKRGSTRNNCWQNTSLLQNRRWVKTLNFTILCFCSGWKRVWITSCLVSGRVRMLQKNIKRAPAHRTSWNIYSEDRAPGRALLQSPPVCFGSRCLFWLPQTWLEIVQWSPYNITKTLKHRLEQWSMAWQPFPLQLHSHDKSANRVTERRPYSCEVWMEPRELGPAHPPISPSVFSPSY